MMGKEHCSVVLIFCISHRSAFPVWCRSAVGEEAPAVGQEVSTETLLPWRENTNLLLRSC